ncbi:hypothetical protein ACKWTF_015035 [Chironomus riparius]
MDLKLRLFSLVCIATNLNLIYSYSCRFEDNQYVGYLCELKSNHSSGLEQHAAGKTDDDVKRVELEPFRNWDDKSPLKKSTVNICQRFKNLQRIEVKYLKIEPNFLKGCRNLREIFTKSSEISELPEDFLADNRKLTSLRLRDNNWPTLPENLFAHQQELVDITLTNNQIQSLPKNIFKPAVNVKSIFLSENNIQTLDSELFKNLRNLELLSLSRNKITELPKNIFSSLENLHQIYLENNQFTTIHSDSFGINRNLKIINLSWNKIEAFDEKLIDNTALEVLEMHQTSCIENLGINDRLDIKLMRMRMKKCFVHYQSRQA